MIPRSCLILIAMVAASPAEEAVQFTRDVLPILSRNCFPCHGPDEESRQADLRLDREGAALDAGVIATDDLEGSELLLRIRSEDPDVVMPPPDAHRDLSAADRATLEKWVMEGASYATHWAFLPPTQPNLPDGEVDAWPRNPVDAFLLARMQAEGRQPSPPADRYTLIRRVYLDLLGLPPTPADADAFVNNPSATAYEELVEALLRSPHYGEHLARQWLDIARYADTNGYEKDRPRSIWPYRDWVIRALNDDMPFDQFSIEQLAGDMLPQPTVAQRVATGFHRNTMLNEEGGIDPLEYRFYAMVDRVATTGTVWMGLTVGCAQCHSHKYDPISHTDYYRLMALLNNADEPDLVLPSSSREHDEAIRAKLAAMQRSLVDRFPPDGGTGDEQERRSRHLKSELSKWIHSRQQQLAAWTIATPTSLRANLPILARLPDDSIFASGDFTKRDEYFISVEVPKAEPFTALRLEALPDERLPAGGPGRAYYEGRKGDFFLSELEVAAHGNRIPIASASRSYGKIAVGSGNADAANVYDREGSTGWSTAHREGERHVLVLRFAEPIQATQFDIKMLFERHFVAGLGRFRFSFTSTQGNVTAIDLDAEVESILLRDEASWTDEEQARVRAEFLDKTELLAEARKPIEQLAQQLAQRTTTMVMQERAVDHSRPTYRHHRGEWLSPREAVTPGLPSIFSQSSSDGPADRLAFARWLVSPENPLVARVVVNRVWRNLMGHGLVRSDGDFGSQADPPSHPQLLDWLACEFMQQGWSLKYLHRMIVLSAAYRQTSHLASDPAGRDVTNRWFARGPRHRVDAETIRDVMLAASGLLSPDVGGPSVFPPQPDEVTAIAYGGTQWQAAAGPQRYRRSLYTFRKRTAPFAAYTTFDGPSHEICTAKRARSNTPLQALTLLNDAMYLEMARALAARAKKTFPQSNQRQIVFMFRSLLTRPPTPEEIARLTDYFASQTERLMKGKLVAAELVASEDDDVAWAALTLVARVLMNLDETITKQ